MQVEESQLTNWGQISDFEAMWMVQSAAEIVEDLVVLPLAGPRHLRGAVQHTWEAVSSESPHHARSVARCTGIRHRPRMQLHDAQKTADPSLRQDVR